MKRIRTFLAFVAPVLLATGVSGADKHGPPTFGLERVPALQGDWGEYPLWQYCASLVWVALAFIAAPVVDFLMTRVLKRLTAKTETDLDDKLLEVLHTPVKIAALLVMLHVGISEFEWPRWAEKILSPLFIIAVSATVIYTAVRIVDLVVGYAEQRFFGGDQQLAQLMLPVLGRTAKAFVIIIGGLTTAQHLGFPITSVIAGLGIGGIAVALAAQNTLANIFGSMTILADQPFKVGDVVRIDAVEGKVEAIGLRSTRIRTPDGHFVTIPNKTVADASIVNISMRPTIHQPFTISLTYDASAERVKEAVGILCEILKSHPMTHDFTVNWKSYAPSSLDILVAYWCKTTNQKEFLKALEEINLEIKRRFDAAGLEFAFPTQTIQLQAMPPKT